MDILSEILKEHSKRQCVNIGNWVSDNPSRFQQLMEHFLRGEYRVTQRAAWVVSYCALRHPALIEPWLPAMLKRMQEPGVHVAVKRNVLRILADLELPRPLHGRIMSICFDELASPGSAIAVKVHAMAVLANLARIQPAIVNELRSSLEQILPNAGPALRARIRIVTKKLARQKSRGVRP